MMDSVAQELRVLILAPVGKDGALARGVLTASGISSTVCSSMRELVTLLREEFGSILLAEEALDPVSTRMLAEALKGQAAWSDAPIVLLTSRGESGDASARVWSSFAASGNVSVLERPVRTSTLVSVLQVALRSRRRQYQVRKLLAEQVEAMRLRDEFMSIASHELRTPITSLKLHAQLTQRMLTKEETSGLPVRLGKFLRNSESQINRLAKLVEDMLDVSRINVGKLTISREEFDLAEVIGEVIERFAPQLGAAGITVALDVPPCRGSWDRYRLEQVLNNLLTNAIRYAPGAPVKIGAETYSDRVVLRFSDRGPGVPSDKLGLIFGRFERATTGFGITGLGLGLYISRQIVEAHGGTIEAESLAGNGLSFTITLPRGEVALPEIHSAS